MRVKMTKTSADAKRALNEGYEYNVSDAEGRALVKAGAAVPVKSVEAERAVEPAAENAAAEPKKPAAKRKAAPKRKAAAKRVSGDAG